MPEEVSNLLLMQGITKRFPGVVALKEVALELRRGEVLALMGENGAGKSTLMKILGGAYPPDEGRIVLHGGQIHLRSVADAKRHGIALIHQELMLAGNLTIADNIFLGNEKRRWGVPGLLDRRRMNDEARRLLDRVGLHAVPTTPVATLTAGQMQMVEIAKALSLDARLIIMDEPTSSLTSAESEHLFRIIDELRRGGISVIYISHRIEEVLRIADRITVLRDGKNVGEIAAAGASHDQIVSMMVGRMFTTRFPQRPAHQFTHDVLVMRDVIVNGSPWPLSFEARRGEIVGFAGLVGAGRTELMQVIFGASPSLGGTMFLEGQPYRPRSTRDAIQRGVFLAPRTASATGLYCR